MSKIAAHYTSGTLLERLNASLADDGADPAHPTMEALAPYDQFHGRGLEATDLRTHPLRLELRHVAAVIDRGEWFEP